VDLTIHMERGGPPHANINCHIILYARIDKHF